MTGDGKIKVGSRKSELALIQTRHVISLLKETYPDKEFEIVTMNTLGDKVLDIPLPKIGEKSLFTKELETALQTGAVDFVVHSLKDLPTCLPEGMAIGAVLQREDPRDALVLCKDLQNHDLSSLPEGSVVGTSSLRRTAQLHRKYPHLKIEDIRGNLNTRLRKLDELGKFQAIILAVAGLHRMGWHERVTKILECKELLYAVGQGALAVECRDNDPSTIELLRPLYDPETAIRVIVERTFLQKLGGGCSAPVAISTEISNIEREKHKLAVTGAVWSLDGKEEITENLEIYLNLHLNNQCSKCPYNGLKIGTKKKLSVDSSLSEEVPSKIAKIEENPQVNLIINDDSHTHCPINFPIGAEFMGKCPFLEAKEHGDIIDDMIKNADVSKCPFMSKHQNGEDTNGNTSAMVCTRNSVDNGKFCGLVPHKTLPADIMEEARKLGVKLADTLISKGALEVMSKAQAHIRGSV